MNRDPLLLVGGSSCDDALLERMLAALRAGSYSVVERRPIKSGEEAIDDIMLATDDGSLPVMEMTRGIGRTVDPIPAAIECLSFERRGPDFVDRMWTILRGVIMTVERTDDRTAHVSAHTECPFHDLIVQTWNAERTRCVVDPGIATKLRPMVFVDSRRESVPEAPEGTSRVIGLSAMFCYASQENADSMETLRALQDLDALAADPTYGRDPTAAASGDEPRTR